jgi:hypothetical protein
VKTIKIEDYINGMILAKDITSKNGQVLLPKGAVLTTDNIKSLKKRDVTHIVVEDKADRNLPVFSEEEIEKTKEMYYDIVAQRFLDPASDNMIRALFQAVLEHTARRILSGK